MAKRSVIETSLFDFVDKNTPNEVTVIFAEEVSGSQGPRPKKPFTTIKILSGPTTVSFSDNLRFKSDPLGPNDPRTENSPSPVYSLGGIRGYSVSLQAFGVGSQDNLQFLQDIMNSPEVVENFKLAGDIAIVSRGSIIDLSALIDTGYERRHSLDIVFNSASNVDVEAGAIEKAEIEGTLEKTDIDAIDIEPFTVPET